VNIVGEKSFEVALVQGDNLVEQVTSATAKPALSNAVLPGTLNGGLDRSNLHRTNGNWNFQPIFRVVIKK
jgi:hypothetical protein